MRQFQEQPVCSLPCRTWIPTSQVFISFNACADQVGGLVNAFLLYNTWTLAVLPGGAQVATHSNPKTQTTTYFYSPDPENQTTMTEAEFRHLQSLSPPQQQSVAGFTYVDCPCENLQTVAGGRVICEGGGLLTAAGREVAGAILMTAAGFGIWQFLKRGR